MEKIVEALYEFMSNFPVVSETTYWKLATEMGYDGTLEELNYALSCH